jgi:L,D-transpeptidase YcbB
MKAAPRPVVVPSRRRQGGSPPWWAALLLLLALFTGCESRPKPAAVVKLTAPQAPATTASALADVSIPPIDSTTVEAYFNGSPQLQDHRTDALNFYRERAGRLGWFRNGTLVPQTQNLLTQATDAQAEGLNPAHYQPLIEDVEKHFAALRAIKKGDPDAAEKVRQTDLVLSGLYFAFAGDMYKGVLDPHTNEALAWEVRRNKVKLYHSLQAILKERDSSYPNYEFGAVHPDYTRLRSALRMYRALEKRGGWSVVPAVKKLVPGQVDSVVVAALRRRLAAEPVAPGIGDATASIGATQPAPTVAVSAKAASALAPADPDRYDDTLVASVKTFQDRHGLNPDGLVGPGTVAALNVPVRARIEQLILNMERWRWVPRKLGARYVLVNIPEFKLHVVEGDTEQFSMRVIVGKELKQTPVFSDKIQYIVLAPYWGIPASIVEEEIKPAVLRDRGYLARHQMELLDGKRVISSRAVNWRTVTRANWHYTLRQKPGAENPLGTMKFIFPNDHNVYLHGTPNGWLFNKEGRGFSHGCVRLEDPRKLADYLLQPQPAWTAERISSTIAAGTETWIALPEPVPVYIVYFTAWVSPDGRVQFRDDVYGHDQALEKEFFS